MSAIEHADPAIWHAIQAERARQRYNLEMIASENYTSRAVMEAQGSCLTNKYAEGYPGKRYYGGCEFVDEVEKLAIDRAKQLYGAQHANVQPHSGAQANMAVFLACLKPADTIMGLDLAHGGHLTHGMRLNFSGKYFHVASYGVRQDTHRIDFDELRTAAHEAKPKLLIAGASAYPRSLDFAKFAEIAREVGALFMVDMAHISGLVAAKLHPDPVPHADFVTSTTHKTLRGPRSGMILCTEEWAKKIDSAVFPGIQGGPLMHVVAAKAIAYGEALQPNFRDYIQQVLANAKVLAESFLSADYQVVSGGTDTHLVLVDICGKNGVTGRQAEEALDSAGITVNKNMIPFDPRKPMDPSGVRFGTPALTTRGFREAEMHQVGKWILDVLERPTDEDLIARVRGNIRELCEQFPAPSEAA